MSERPVEVEGAIAHLNSPADTPRTTFDALDPMLEGRRGGPGEQSSSGATSTVGLSYFRELALGTQVRPNSDGWTSR